MHDIIKTASCNACHDQLSAHGGSRRGMDMCVLCHQPQNIDPNTGLPWMPRCSFIKFTWGQSPQREGGDSLCAGHELTSGPLTTRPWSSRPIPGDPRALRDVCHSQTTRCRAGDRISDQSDARGLRLLPR